MFESCRAHGLTKPFLEVLWSQKNCNSYLVLSLRRGRFERVERSESVRRRRTGIR
jgi:hypothetical protein